jgi:hypothetical protein
MSALVLDAGALIAGRWRASRRRWESASPKSLLETIAIDYD